MYETTGFTETLGHRDPSLVVQSADLLERRSNRVFSELPRAALGGLLWLSARTIASTVLPTGLRSYHRPAPSAGGLHPIDLVILDTHPKYRSFVYDPDAHQLVELNTEPKLLRELAHAVSQVLDPQAGIIVLFAGDFERTLGKYFHGESLVWRDSGALQATIEFAAYQLGLNACGIGITGEPFVSSLLRSSGRVLGVGGIVVGSPGF